MGTWSVKQKEFFGTAGLEKKFVFQSEISTFRLLFAYSIFKNIEISSGQGVVQIKPNLVWSIPWVLECKTKRIFGIACLEKSSCFDRKYRPIRLFYFQKYRNFVGSRSCPN